VLQESADSVAVSSEALLPGARVIVSDLKVVTEGMAVRVVDEPRDASTAVPAGSR